jgi:three-Cys-motif partner protein
VGRVFQGWTLDKLEVLRIYLKLYRRVAGSGTYIDAFCGDGQVMIDGESVPRDGTALISVRSKAFKWAHFIDLDSKLTARLQTRIDEIRLRKNEERTVYCGDSNVVLRTLFDSGVIDRDRPLFVCLDQNSTELLWSTVEMISHFKDLDVDANRCKAELWILFNQYQVIQRLWPVEPRLQGLPNPYARSLNGVFGSYDAWADLWTSKADPLALMHRYCQRLEGLGYQYVLPQLIKSDAGPQYYMIHATDHVAAVDFMRWAKNSHSKQKGRGQQSTFALGPV